MEWVFYWLAVIIVGLAAMVILAARAQYKGRHRAPGPPNRGNGFIEFDPKHDVEYHMWKPKE